MSEGSVYWRSDGRWVAKYKDTRGQWRYLYRKSKTEAKQALIVVVSAVDPLAVRSELWVNRGRSGSACGGVEIPIRRWVNIIDHRYRLLLELLGQRRGELMVVVAELVC